MSETAPLSPQPLAAFAASLRPQLTGTVAAKNRQSGASHTINTFTQGHPDEIWLKLLEINHGIERHTLAEWHALIDNYRHQPAHETDPNYVAGT